MELPRAVVARLAAHAALASEQSPDPRTKVGCVLVGPSLAVVATGHNDFPPGLAHSPERWEAPGKYDRVLHAEAAAVADAARRGTPTAGCLAVVTKFPCGACVRLLLQSGVRGLVVPLPDGDQRWAREYAVARELLDEARIGVCWSTV